MNCDCEPSHLDSLRMPRSAPFDRKKRRSYGFGTMLGAQERRLVFKSELDCRKRDQSFSIGRIESVIKTSLLTRESESDARDEAYARATNSFVTTAR